MFFKRYTISFLELIKYNSSSNIQFINNNVLTNNNKKRKITNETDVCHGKLININNHWNSDDKLEVYWCID